METVLQGVLDNNLRFTLAFGIGLHHAGLHEKDRKTVEELFVNQKIQVDTLTNQSTDQSIDQSVNQSINQSIKSTNHQFCLSFSQNLSQSVGYEMYLRVSRSANHPLIG